VRAAKSARLLEQRHAFGSHRTQLVDLGIGPIACMFDSLATARRGNAGP
jgi:hypothetical protein